MKKNWVLILLVFFMISCQSDKNNINRIDDFSEKELKEKLIEANKIAAQKESIQIDGYVSRRKLDVTKTGTGLRYHVYDEGNGEKAENGKIAVVKYSVSLIDGTICYSTKDNEVEEFIIGKDNVESGLHEGITYLKVGDKAKIIIPSYLAHGLAGDFKKIPVRSTIIYDIELIDLK
ncbi:FKBP-type peptidyl-prolyl cis-trans isomerase [Vicingus serpentipes]|uniref:Peptidyl-prolyl cis-trans isomerase n=1 Tax=Vicingus serpentipes TaxID=1926625 RepID=A0A5C6RUK5_9FLAO|nr:FKBP-type peptidyl-prolyl cis-trans isomerase [Vicingus serpentipes]TXB66001.1 FKBP-type peptidyl-prolyl cis-trans isomerase [Vicingus serpentipes]